MTDFRINSLIKFYTLYTKIVHVIIIALAVLSCVMGLYDNTVHVVVFCLTAALLFCLDSVFVRLNYYNSDFFYIAFKFFEIICFSFFQAFMPNEILLLAVICMFTMLLSIEFILQGVDYDSSVIFSRKIMLCVVAILNVGLAFSRKNEKEWISYLLLQIVAIIIVFFVADWIEEQSIEFNRIRNKLSLEKTDIESANEKLVEYQKRVKTINEQINYQKIDLARVVKELEQANIEIESQTEVMRYMASTFDVLKCIDVITDVIMEVKKPKLCALYVDKDVYMNKYPSVVVKTNFTSMERRLKKDVADIYSEFCSESSESTIVTGDELKKYRFIGDANINAIAVLPLVNERIYGIMIIGSDREDFFEKGLKYYEACIVEFDVSIKSTLLYLQTQNMARKDGLTGIYNRIYFNELFSAAGAEAAKKGSALSVALFDIDKFKSVNDTYGHLTGDEVIKMVAGVGAKYAEKYNGFACRYGGEEFLLVLPGYDESGMLPVLEAMHEEIKATQVHHNGVSLFVNVCIGFSSYPNLCDNTDILISRADKAMYYGKKNGRGRLVMDNPQIDENMD